MRPNIGIRGASSDRSKKITLMEDGVLLGPAPYSAPSATYFPLVARIAGVQVVKGPAGVIFGPQTIGGAINLMTREIPASPRGSLQLAAGSFGHSKVHALYGASDEQTGFLVEGAHLGSEGFRSIDGLRGGGDTGFSRNELMVKIRRIVDPGARIKNELSLKLGYSSEALNEASLGLSDADFASAPDRRYAATRLDRTEGHRTQIELTHRAIFSRRLSITTTIYRHDMERSSREAEADLSSTDETVLLRPLRRVFVSQGMRTVVGWQVRTAPVHHRVEYGLRLHADQATRLEREEGLLVKGGALVPDGGAARITGDERAFTQAMALHLIDSMTIGELTVSPGARLEIVRSGLTDSLARSRELSSYGIFLPGVGAHYALAPSFGALGGIHRGFSPAPPGASGALPESSVNYEGGLRYSSGGTRVEGVAFLDDYSNLTSRCALPGACPGQGVLRPFDVGGAWIYGVEIFVERRVKLPLGIRIPIRVVYTYTGSKLLTSFHSADPIYGVVNEGDELPHIPKDQLSVTLGLDYRRWSMDLSALHVGRMRERPGIGPDPLMTEGSLVLDASAHLSLTPSATLYLVGRNLTDTAALVSRKPLGARAVAPRSLQLGLKLDF